MNQNNYKAGKAVMLRHERKVLKGNPLGDKQFRDLIVNVPPGYEDYNEFVLDLSARILSKNLR